VSGARVWLVVSPVIAAGVLTAHSLAYRVTGTPAAPLHSYLEHAPQVLVVLALCALVTGAFGRRLAAPSPWAFPVVAVASFFGQEQLERLVHGEWTLSVLTAPVFLVGLALQVPVAFVVWLVARWLVTVVGDAPAEPLARGSFGAVVAAVPPTPTRVSTGIRTPPGRAPPALAPSS
jgi:hypothetical protein